jgi:hypothetical protein
MGNIHLPEEKPAKKRIRSNLTDRIPQKPVWPPQARLRNHRERRTVREFFAVVIEGRLEGF